MQSHRDEVETLGLSSSDVETARAEAFGMQSKPLGSVLRWAGYDGLLAPARRCGELWRRQNIRSKAVTKTWSKSIFLSRREDRCVPKGSCLEQEKWKEILTIHLLITFLNFKIKVTTKSWQNADKRKHQKSAPRGFLERKCYLAGQRFSVSAGRMAAKALREKALWCQTFIPSQVVTFGWRIQSHLRFVVARLLSCVQPFVTPWTASCRASLSFTISRNLLKFIFTESMMPSNHLILCLSLLLLPSVFPSIRVFSNESVHIR